MRKKLNLYATVALVVALGGSCAQDGMNNSYRPSPTAHRACTPEARAASMRKALRETPRGQKIHQQYVEKG